MEIREPENDPWGWKASKRNAVELFRNLMPELDEVDRPTDFFQQPVKIGHIEMEYGLAAVSQCLKNNSYECISYDRLDIIATEVRRRGPRDSNAVYWEEDISEFAAVYVFLDMLERECIKIGETDNARRRLVQHLRTGQDQTTLRGYFSRFSELSREIVYREITLLVFRVPNAGDESSRKACERGLKSLLNPEIK